MLHRFVGFCFDVVCCRFRPREVGAKASGRKSDHLVPLSVDHGPEEEAASG
ncbi:hypothetical protein CRUP_037798 [Coryphaenoides rupestris]|nr:hypothetical protein CRUP_037798 [Coryphaenoides rupestris]